MSKSKPTKKAAATKTPTPARASTPSTHQLGVGQLVKHTYEDVPTASTVTTVGIVTEITDDGAYVAPLSSAAVVPLDQLRAL